MYCILGGIKHTAGKFVGKENTLHFQAIIYLRTSGSIKNKNSYTINYGRYRAFPCGKKKKEITFIYLVFGLTMYEYFTLTYPAA